MPVLLALLFKDRLHFPVGAEVAYRLRYITSADLGRLSHAMRGSPYGQYLASLLEDEL